MVFTINYDNLVSLMEELGGRWPFGTVILDESTRLKSFRLRRGGKHAAALGKVAHKHVRRWLNLTGRPAPNSLVDLWGQAWLWERGFDFANIFTKPDLGNPELCIARVPGIFKQRLEIVTEISGINRGGQKLPREDGHR